MEAVQHTLQLDVAMYERDAVHPSHRAAKFPKESTKELEPHLFPVHILIQEVEQFSTRYMLQHETVMRLSCK